MSSSSSRAAAGVSDAAPPLSPLYDWGGGGGEFAFTDASDSDGDAGGGDFRSETTGGSGWGMMREAETGREMDVGAMLAGLRRTRSVHGRNRSVGGLTPVDARSVSSARTAHSDAAAAAHGERVYGGVWRDHREQQHRASGVGGTGRVVRAEDLVRQYYTGGPSSSSAAAAAASAVFTGSDLLLSDAASVRSGAAIAAVHQRFAAVLPTSRTAAAAATAEVALNWQAPAPGALEEGATVPPRAECALLVRDAQDARRFARRWGDAPYPTEHVLFGRPLFAYLGSVVLVRTCGVPYYQHRRVVYVGRVLGMPTAADWHARTPLDALGHVALQHVCIAVPPDAQLAASDAFALPSQTEEEAAAEDQRAAVRAQFTYCVHTSRGEWYELPLRLVLRLYWSCPAYASTIRSAMVVAPVELSVGGHGSVVVPIVPPLAIVAHRAARAGIHAFIDTNLAVDETPILGRDAFETTRQYHARVRSNARAAAAAAAVAEPPARESTPDFSARASGQMSGKRSATAAAALQAPGDGVVLDAISMFRAKGDPGKFMARAAEQSKTVAPSQSLPQRLPPPPLPQRRLHVEYEDEDDDDSGLSGTDQGESETDAEDSAAHGGAPAVPDEAPPAAAPAAAALPALTTLKRSKGAASAAAAVAAGAGAAAVAVATEASEKKKAPKKPNARVCAETNAQLLKRDNDAVCDTFYALHATPCATTEFAGFGAGCVGLGKKLPKSTGSKAALGDPKIGLDGPPVPASPRTKTARAEATVAAAAVATEKASAVAVALSAAAAAAAAAVAKSAASPPAAEAVPKKPAPKKAAPRSRARIPPPSASVPMEPADAAAPVHANGAAAEPVHANGTAAVPMSDDADAPAPKRARAAKKRAPAVPSPRLAERAAATRAKIDAEAAAAAAAAVAAPVPEPVQPAVADAAPAAEPPAKKARVRGKSAAAVKAVAAAAAAADAGAAASTPAAVPTTDTAAALARLVSAVAFIAELTLRSAKQKVSAPGYVPGTPIFDKLDGADHKKRSELVRAYDKWSGVVKDAIAICAMAPGAAADGALAACAALAASKAARLGVDLGAFPVVESEAAAKQTPVEFRAFCAMAYEYAPAQFNMAHHTDAPAATAADDLFADF